MAITHVNHWDNAAQALTTLAVSPASLGNVLMFASNAGLWNSTVTIQSISGGGVTTWTKVIAAPYSTTPFGAAEIWCGVVTTTGSSTITVTWTTSTPTYGIDYSCDEFSAGLGAGTVWSSVASGQFDINASQVAVGFPNLSTDANGASEFYFGWGCCGVDATSSGTPGGFTFTPVSQNLANYGIFKDLVCYGLSLAASTGYTPSGNMGSSSTSQGVGCVMYGQAGSSSGMVVTNQTAADYWFGPLHLKAGVGQTLVVDDRTDTSLYLYDDEVADPLNNLFLAGKVTVSGAASPFPRPTGEAEVLRGDGSPEGRVFAPQGSGYLRRDTTGAANAFYVKTTGVAVSTGWDSIAGELVGSVTGTYDLVSSTTETSLISGAVASSTTGFRIPAKTIPVNGALRLTIVGDYLNSTGSAQSCTLRIKFGGTVFYGDAVGSIASSVTRHPARIELVLVNLNATNSNLLVGAAPAWGGGTPATGSVAGTYGGIADARLVTSGVQAIDTTLDQFLDVTATHSANSSSLSIRRLAAFAELL